MITAKQRKRIASLHAMLGSPNAAERESARRKLDALLSKLGKGWNDIPELLAQWHADEAAKAPAGARDPRDHDDDPRDHGSHPFDRPGAPMPADTVRHVIEQFVALQPHESVAVALWCIHTHVYATFMVTPRLLLSSPVRGCGKTTLLDVIERLVVRAEKSDNITAAALYHAIATTRRTLLLDEADNLEMSAKAVLRAVLNAGYRRGGNITRLLRNQSVRFSVFAPIALAAIGLLTLPLISRSIVVHMRRADPQTMQSLRRFDLADTSDLDLVYSHIAYWLKGTKLNLDPPMPAELSGRSADNWRPLLSIADACGPQWSALARDAAVTFARSEHEEDVAVLCLWCIREVFDARGVDRLASKELVADLIALETADDMWREFRGPTGNGPARRLTSNALARLLRPFGIAPRPLWPLHRTDESRSARGYFRADFEAAWASYCDGTVTPSQLKRLRLVK